MAKKSAEEKQISAPKMREIIALSAINEVNKAEEQAAQADGKKYRGGADLIEFLRMGWRG